MATQKDYDNLNNANQRLADILAVKPSKDRAGKTIYVFEGEELTKYGYDKKVKKQREEVQKFRDIIVPPAVKEERQAAVTGRARQQAEELTASLTKLTRIRKDFEMASSKASTSQERERLDRWVRVYRDKETEFQNAISQLASDIPLLAPPQMPQMITPDQAKTLAIAEPQVPEKAAAPETTATTTTGVFGQRVTVPGAGVAAPTTPAVAPSRMPTVSLEQINAARKEQGLPLVELVDGKYREVVTKKEVPAAEVSRTTGQPATTGGTVGAGGTGGRAVGGTPTGAVPPGAGLQVPADWEQAAKELYGAYYDMIKDDPEIKSLLERAIREQWDTNKFDYELSQTKWFKTTNQRARAFETLETTDPAEARRQLDNRIFQLKETAQKLGVTLSDQKYEEVARQSIKLGVDFQAQFEDMIGSAAIESSNTVSQLRFGYIGQSIRDKAAEYGIGLSDTTFNEWVGKIATGNQSIETLDSYLNQTARTFYPSLSSGFDRGLTFKQMTDPYAVKASQILEIPQSQIDFTDPKWAQAFTFRNDKGEQTQMSYGEWADYLRTTPAFGWEYTDDAKSRAYSVVNDLARLFGAA